ncbi:thiolase family protein [Aliiroseovarius sp. YM-037]|uniref:thiolase family protein n=1 Tax=Aliiroseovarius sp. YM-037 TaxID=3341728 RepID=UPI003A80390A
MTAYVAAARRTPVAPRDGAFKAVEPHDLGAAAVIACLADAGIAVDEVDELIAGNAIGPGGNPARVTALAAGLPHRVAGLSVDRQCAGGLDALRIAAAMIDAGQADIVIAGGAESYSRRPIRHRTFDDGRAPVAYDQPPFAPDANQDPDMAEAAARLAERLGISRADQDDWAVRSHEKALAAREQMRREIAQVPNTDLDHDPFTRRLTHRVAERAAQIVGPITNANTAVAADGAAFCAVVSEGVAKRVNRPTLRIVSGATVGADPALPGLAPVAAIKSALSQAKLNPTDLTAAEIMEAYAAQAIACVNETGLSAEVTNLGGGALARGHPIGASGAVLAVRLYHELTKRGGSGLAAIAAAGGIGSALVMQTP